MMIQRRSFAESVRPELVLIGWSRVVDEGNHARDSIVVEKVKNVGRGTAFNIHLQASGSVHAPV